MENQKSYIIQHNRVVTAKPTKHVGDNLSRHTVTIVNNGSAGIRFSTLGRVGVGVGVELAPKQTVTITQQYDGDFARVDLEAVSDGGNVDVTAYELILYERVKL